MPHIDAKQPNFTAVAAKLKHLENHFDVNNPVGGRPNAILLGQELAKIGMDGLAAFKIADQRLTSILEHLIGGEMGTVAGAVERAFHSGIADGAKDLDVLRANKASQRERGL